MRFGSDEGQLAARSRSGMVSSSVDSRFCSALRLAVRCLGACGALFIQREAHSAVQALVATSGEVPSAIAASVLRRMHREPGAPKRRSSDQARTQWINVGGPDRPGRILSIHVLGLNEEWFTLAVYYDNQCKVTEDDALSRSDTLTEEVRSLVNLYCELRGSERKIRSLSIALENAAFAVAVLDDSGDIAFLNKSARELLESGDCIRTDRGGLTAADLGAAIKLQAAISHVRLADAGPRARNRRAPMLLLPRADGTSILCALLPSEEDVVCYFVDSGSKLETIVTSVCRLHDLSPVETRLAASLATGATVAEAAERLRIKEMTARAYLKQIFVKTGTRRQADLVRVLLTHAAPIRGDLEFATLT